MKDKEVSKFLSYVLRHHPEEIGIVLEDGGWVSVGLLIAACEQHKKAITIEQIRKVVTTGNRHVFNEDETKIRAAQGHSVEVDLDLKIETPPDKLYHGTAERFMDKIRVSGSLLPMDRHDVHLTTSLDKAHSSGKRYDKQHEPVILEIDAAGMHKDGHVFRLADNGVWLVERVPLQYVKVHGST